MPIYERNFVSVLKERLGSPDLLIQTVLGPRQVGKTTGVLQLIESRNEPSLYASADDVLGDGGWWIREKWQEAAQKADDCLLVLDEIQKIEK